MAINWEDELAPQFREVRRTIADTYGVTPDDNPEREVLESAAVLFLMDWVEGLAVQVDKLRESVGGGDHPGASSIGGGN